MNALFFLFWNIPRTLICWHSHIVTQTEVWCLSCFLPLIQLSIFPVFLFSVVLEHSFLVHPYSHIFILDPHLICPYERNSLNTDTAFLDLSLSHLFTLCRVIRLIFLNLNQVRVPYPMTSPLIQAPNWYVCLSIIYLSNHTSLPFLT